jgi:hypothetical protein
VGLWPALGAQAEEASARFHDRAAYAATVLQGEQLPPAGQSSGQGVSVGSGLLLASGAVALGALALFRRRLPKRFRRATMAPVRPALNALRFVHSGEVQDYVAWATLGVAALGGAFALMLG